MLIAGRSEDQVMRERYIPPVFVQVSANHPTMWSSLLVFQGGVGEAGLRQNVPSSPPSPPTAREL